MVSGPGSPGAVIVAVPEVATPLEFDIKHHHARQCAGAKRSREVQLFHSRVCNTWRHKSRSDRQRCNCADSQILAHDVNSCWRSRECNLSKHGSFSLKLFLRAVHSCQFPDFWGLIMAGAPFDRRPRGPSRKSDASTAKARSVSGPRAMCALELHRFRLACRPLERPFDFSCVT